MASEGNVKVSLIDVLDDGVKSCQEHMAKDEALLKDAQSLQKPLLRFYAWKRPSVTFGHFIDPYKHLNKDALEKHSVDIAKRSTGGGILFHHYDFSFSILYPHDYPDLSNHVIDNYALVNNKVLKSLEVLDASYKESISLWPTYNTEVQNFCMAKPTQFDLIYNGKKIGGAAQRRTKMGLLHQSSIFLFTPVWCQIEEIVHKEHKDALLRMRKVSQSILQEDFELSIYEKVQSLLKAELSHQFAQ